MTPKMLSDAVMRLVDLLAMNPAETREIDPRSWDRLRIYMPNDPYAEKHAAMVREACGALLHIAELSSPRATSIQRQIHTKATDCLGRLVELEAEAKSVPEIVTVSPAVAQKETDPAPGSGSPLKSAIGASGGGREDGDSPAAETENEKGQTEAEALGFDRELSREVMESGDRAMAKLATENGIANIPDPSPAAQQAGVREYRNPYWGQATYNRVCAIYRAMVAVERQNGDSLGQTDDARDAAKWRRLGSPGYLMPGSDTVRGWRDGEERLPPGASRVWIECESETAESNVSGGNP